jgi:hypothetical protein
MAAVKVSTVTVALSFGVLGMALGSLSGDLQLAPVVGFVVGVSLPGLYIAIMELVRSVFRLAEDYPHLNTSETERALQRSLDEIKVWRKTAHQASVSDEGFSNSMRQPSEETNEGESAVKREKQWK